MACLPVSQTGLPLLWVANYVNRHPGSEETRVLLAPSERTGRVACDGFEIPRPLMAPPALQARGPTPQLTRAAATKAGGIYAERIRSSKLKSHTGGLSIPINPTLSDGKTSAVLRPLVRRRGRVRSTPGSPLMRSVPQRQFSRNMVMMRSRISGLRYGRPPFPHCFLPCSD